MDIEKLEKQVKWSKYILVGIITLALSAYILCFRGLPFGDESAWGQFGDYMGGVMNPLIAFGAFYWLATSVLLQKTELAETRKALVATQEAQQQHADTALLTARIQSINIRMTLVSNELKYHREKQEVLQRILKHSSSTYPYIDEFGDSTTVGAELEWSQHAISRLTREEASLLVKLTALGHEE